MKKRSLDTKRNYYTPPAFTNNPVYGAVEFAYGRIAAKYRLNNYFDVRQARHISYLPNILQRAKSLSHQWPDELPKPGNASAVTDITKMN